MDDRTSWVVKLSIIERRITKALMQQKRNITVDWALSALWIPDDSRKNQTKKITGKLIRKLKKKSFIGLKDVNLKLLFVMAKIIDVTYEQFKGDITPTLKNPMKKSQYYESTGRKPKIYF